MPDDISPQEDSVNEQEQHDIRLRVDRFFCSFAEKAAYQAGSPIAFIVAMGFVLIWLGVGPFFKYSTTWQLVIAIIPAITTFLLVFLIQHSQNRETRAVQLKLNELIRATRGAHTMMLNLEKLTATELEAICAEYEILAQEARQRLSQGKTDQHVPEIVLMQEMPKN